MLETSVWIGLFSIAVVACGGAGDDEDASAGASGALEGEEQAHDQLCDDVGEGDKKSQLVYESTASRARVIGTGHGATSQEACKNAKASLKACGKDPALPKNAMWIGNCDDGSSSAAKAPASSESKEPASSNDDGE